MFGNLAWALCRSSVLPMVSYMFYLTLIVNLLRMICVNYPSLQPVPSSCFADQVSFLTEGTVEVQREAGLTGFCNSWVGS